MTLNLHFQVFLAGFLVLATSLQSDAKTGLKNIWGYSDGIGYVDL
jgi:hypothetical protein